MVFESEKGLSQSELRAALEKSIEGKNLKKESFWVSVF